MENRASLMQLLDAAWRLGPRSVLLAAWHCGAVGRALAKSALRDRAPPAAGRFLPGCAPPPLATLRHAAEVLGRASRLSAND